MDVLEPARRVGRVDVQVHDRLVVAEPLPGVGGDPPRAVRARLLGRVAEHVAEVAEGAAAEAPAAFGSYGGAIHPSTSSSAKNTAIPAAAHAPNRRAAALGPFLTATLGTPRSAPARAAHMAPRASCTHRPRAPPRPTRASRAGTAPLPRPSPPARRCRASRSARGRAPGCPTPSARPRRALSTGSRRRRGRARTSRGSRPSRAGCCRSATRTGRRRTARSRRRSPAWRAAGARRSDRRPRASPRTGRPPAAADPAITRAALT